MRTTILALVLLALPLGLALEVTSPTGEHISPVEIAIAANGTADELSYTVGNLTDMCSNCSDLLDSLELEPGNYTLTATELIGNASTEVIVEFSVILNETDTNETDENETNETEVNMTSLELTVNSPLAQEYESPVSFDFTTNMPATISYRLADADILACENCTSFQTDVNLTDGNHSVFVQAFTENESANETVLFTVVTPDTTPPTNETGNETDEGPTNETGEPRFTVGLNKLPQQLEAGELSDADLAEIIRANRLNPGVINRLVKTGLLGEESLDAIIETQRTPPGIFRRLLGFFGIHIPTAKDNIPEYYNLSDDQAAELMTDEDVSEETVEELRTDLERRGKAPIVPPGQAKTGQTGTAQERTPPGQAKKGGGNASPPSGAKSFNVGKQKSGAPGNSGNAPGRNR